MSYAAWSVIAGEQPTTSKWNILGSNDSSFNDGSGIGAGAILPNNLKSSASSLNTWAWDSYTPVVTSAGGSYTTKSATGAYIQIGKTILFRAAIVITTVGTGTTPIFSLPVTAAGGTTFVCTGRAEGTTGNLLQGKLTDATHSTIFTYSNTDPSASGVTINMAGFYESA